jgi:hypothetical protein
MHVIFEMRWHFIANHSGEKPQVFEVEDYVGKTLLPEAVTIFPCRRPEIEGRFP